jgi:hypothetical protein
LRTAPVPALLDEATDGRPAENELNVTLKLPEADAAATNMEWSITPMTHTVKTPSGVGDVSQLQDAIQNALCPIEGTTEIPEELANATLRSSGWQTSQVGTVSIRSELNLSDSGDEC